MAFGRLGANRILSDENVTDNDSAEDASTEGGYRRDVCPMCLMLLPKPEACTLSRCRGSSLRVDTAAEMKLLTLSTRLIAGLALGRLLKVTGSQWVSRVEMRAELGLLLPRPLNRC
jgi:hypothetical protein